MRCPVVDVCGGCPLANRSYDEHLEDKRAELCRAFAVAGVVCDVPSVVSAGPRIAYRNRIRLQVVDGCVRFFNEHKAVDCAVLEPSLLKLRDRICDFADCHRHAFRNFRHLEIRAVDAFGRASALFVPHTPRPSEVIAELGRDVLTAVAGVDEPPVQYFDIGFGVQMAVPLGAFMQVNSAVNRALVEAVVDGAERRRLTTFADLYAGCGNFTLPLIRRGLTGVAVEWDPAAARALGESTTTVHQADAVAWARAVHPVDGGRDGYDLVIANPPRAGISDVPAIGTLSRRCLAVCSCNPVTLARDVAIAVAAGFVIEEVIPFDMFPWTRHLETLVWLRRTE